MSKKRDKNARRKQLRSRNSTRASAAKSHTNTILDGLGYEITDEPVDDEDFRRLPIDVQDRLEKLYERVQSKPRGTIEELQQLASRYPHIPQLYNYLYAAYAKTGQRKKAVETMTENYEKNPTYLFAKLNYSDYLVESGKPEAVSDIYNGKFDLGALYPDRQRFHITEVVGFHGVIGYYFVATKQYDKAKKCLEVLKAISPHHGYTKRLEISLKTLDTLIA